MTGLDGKDTLIGGNDDDRGNGGKGPDLLKGQSRKRPPARRR
jgi:Ca2+-binding RTX toxin-like protein